MARTTTRDDGEPIVPLLSLGYDAECWATGKGRRQTLNWALYRDADHLVAAGTARTSLGATVALWRAKRRDIRAAGR